MIGDNMLGDLFKCHIRCRIVILKCKFHSLYPMSQAPSLSRCYIKYLGEVDHGGAIHFPYFML